MAMSLAVGLLIDDAIVVRENIVRHIGFGKRHREAALDGTNEIGLAVLATTFCIVAVFLPVAFMGGIIGRFFHQFGVTVAAAVLLSLFVSFTLDPMLSSIWYDPQAARQRPLRAHRELERSSAPTASIARVLGLGAALAQEHAARSRSRAFSAASRCPSTSASNSCPRPTSARGRGASRRRSARRSNLPRPSSARSSAAVREFPEVDYTYATVNTGYANGKNQASLYLRC